MRGKIEARQKPVKQILTIHYTRKLKLKIFVVKSTLLQIFYNSLNTKLKFCNNKTNLIVPDGVDEVVGEGKEAGREAGPVQREQRARRIRSQAVGVNVED